MPPRNEILPNGYRYQTPYGSMVLIEEEDSLSYLNFTETYPYPVKEEETMFLRQVYRQISEYFEGKRREFTFAIQIKGTPFEQKVYRALQQIPYGKTKTYQEIATIIGSPKACRAVGRANHQNAILLAIPCHRVIGKNGQLTGFVAGISLKKKLLSLERGEPECQDYPTCPTSELNSNAS